MLPPLEPDLTPFRITDSDFDFFNIAGFPGKDLFLTHLEKKIKNFFKNE
jgi:hypothetical protein